MERKYLTNNLHVAFFILHCNGDGWGGRIRTSESRFQRPVSYRLTTPQSFLKQYEAPRPQAGASR